MRLMRTAYRSQQSTASFRPFSRNERASSNYRMIHSLRRTTGLLLCVLLRAQGQLPERTGNAATASDIVKATAERYKSAQAVVVHASVKRLQQQGVISSEQTRRVRLLAADGSTRLDVYGESGMSLVVLERDGTVTLCGGAQVSAVSI